MKILVVLLPLVLIVSLGVYLNRSYAYFYDYHGNYFLTSPKKGDDFVIQTSNKIEGVYTMAALGDSLTAGVGADSFEESYTYLLARKFSEPNIKVYLRNLAVPGSNTADIAATQPGEIPESVNLVLILTGTNDVHNLVSPALFEENLEKLISEVRIKKPGKIAILTIPYLGSDDTLLFPYNILLTLRISQFNGIIERLSDQFDLILIDLAGLTTEIRRDPKYYAKDKFHPSSYGYQKWSEVIENASRSSLP